MKVSQFFDADHPRLRAGLRKLAYAALPFAITAFAMPLSAHAQTIVTSTSGGMGEVVCGPQALGNDNDPTQAASKNKNGDYVPDQNGYGKIEGLSWTAGYVPGLDWTIGGGTTAITFDATAFDAKAYPISDILVKGGNGYVVCHAEYYFEGGDWLTLSTGAIGLLNKGGNAPDISHVSFYPGAAQWRSTEPPPEPVCTSKDVGTVALSVQGNQKVSAPGKNWFAAFAYSDTGEPQTAYLYNGDNKNGKQTPVGTVTLTSQDGQVVVDYQLSSGAGWYYMAQTVHYDAAATAAGLLNNGTFAPGQHPVGPSGNSGQIMVPQLGGTTYVIIHLDVTKVTCN
jgi:hypothetical protein